jgi:hypothetical protein
MDLDELEFIALVASYALTAFIVISGASLLIILVT